MKKHKNLWEITEDSLDKSMLTFEIDKSMKSELLKLYKELSPFPEVKNVLEEFKNKSIKIAILSNGTPDLLNHLVKSSNLENLFDDIFSIEEVKIYKPDPKVYDIPVKKYKIKKQEITSLSSNTWDVCGGGNYGYNAIWVNRGNNIFDNLDYKLNNEVNNLKELLNLK